MHLYYVREIIYEDDFQMDVFSYFQIIVDETLIKEEILDSSNEGDIPDPGLEYNSIGPELGPDSGEGMEDNMNLDLAASFDHSDGHTYNSQAGPSGLQGVSFMV